MAWTARPAFASASTQAPAPSAAAGEAEEWEIEEELGEELCEEVEEGYEECSLEEAGEAGEAAPPEECVLQDASARVVASPSNDRVRVVVRYQAVTAASVSIGVRMAGRKGSLQLGGVTRRFSRLGLLQFTERLSDSQMLRANAANRVFVNLHFAHTPDYCHPFYMQRLGGRRTVHGHPVWSQLS
jgi:hypothetical protein